MHGRIADMDAERSKPMLSGLLFCLLSLFPVTTRDDRLALAAPCTCAATPTRSCYVPRERHPHAFREMCLEMRAHFRRRPHARAMAERQTRGAARLLSKGRERPPVRACAFEDAPTQTFSKRAAREGGQGALPPCMLLRMVGRAGRRARAQLAATNLFYHITEERHLRQLARQKGRAERASPGA